MLPKAHLTSHSRMSGSKWMIIPSWLSGLWRSFLCRSSMYSCHLLLISSASVRSIPFLFLIEPIYAWNIALVSLHFLKRSLVSPILLFSSVSFHWSLRKAFLCFLEILWNSTFKWLYLSFSLLLFTSFLFTAMCKASSDNHSALLHFLFLGMILIPVSYTILWISVHSSSDTLSDIIPWSITALTMPVYMENSVVPTELEEVCFHYNPKERQCQRRLKLLHGCTHLTHWQVMFKILQARLQ